MLRAARSAPSAFIAELKRSAKIMNTKLISLIGLLIFTNTHAAYDTQLDFDVTWLWRYNLSTNSMDASFVPFAMKMTVYVDTSLLDRITSGSSTRIRFGPALFKSPFSTVVDMGVNMSSGDNFSFTSGSSVQDTFITETNQGTWTYISQSSATAIGSYSQSIQYTQDPRLLNPSGFGSEDFKFLLQSHVNNEFSYREDVSYTSGGGWQNLAKASLVNVVAIPEPSSFGVILGFFMLLILPFKRIRK